MTNLDMNTPVAGIGSFAGALSGRRQLAATQTRRMHADIAARLAGIAAGCPQLAAQAQAGLDVLVATAPASRASAPRVAHTNDATKQKDNHRRRPNGPGMNQ